MFLAYVVFRDAKLRDFGKVIKNALKTLAIVMTLLATAKAFAYMMTELRIPAAARDRLLLLEKDGEIIWIEAVGAAEGYAAKPNFPALELTVTDMAGITRI